MTPKSTEENEALLMNQRGREGEVKPMNKSVREDRQRKGNAKENFYEEKEGCPVRNGSTSPACGTFSQTITF